MSDRRRDREPSRRRYGVIYRRSGRTGMTVMDWVNDGGRDEPANTHDTLVIVAWGVGLVVLAMLIAAVLMALHVKL